MSDLACPCCGSEFDLAVLFRSADDQQALARLVAVSVPLGARIMQYLTLHTPPKTRLTAAKKIKLLTQLLPDLERQAVNYKGRDWTTPLALWAQAIDQMMASAAAGRLDLPLKGHGYLLSVLTGLADKAEAVIEAQDNAARRTPAATVTVHGQPKSIADTLAGGNHNAPIPPAPPPGPRAESPTVRRMKAEMAAKKTPNAAQ